MKGAKIERRTFLAGLPLSAWLLLTHVAGGAAGGRSAAGPRELRGNASPRLRRLELATAAELSDLERFYGELLGLPVLERRADRLTIGGGETPITFYPTPEDYPAPFYHFAFNIPENKILAAREWQLERRPLDPPDPSLRDPELPPDIVHFRNWDAHSIFFWDPAGNLVEYIARHTLNNAAAGPFTSRDILYASEIALVTDDTGTLADELRRTFSLDSYGDGSPAFRAVGDELGLLLVMRRGRKMGWAHSRPIDVSPVEVEISARQTAELRPSGHPFRVVSG